MMYCFISYKSICMGEPLKYFLKCDPKEPFFNYRSGFFSCKWGILSLIRNFMHHHLTCNIAIAAKAIIFFTAKVKALFNYTYQRMPTQHQIIIGNSQQMSELDDGSVQLMVTSPPYPMIAMWDELFCKADPKIATLWRKLERRASDATVRQLYKLMHENLAKVWAETYRVLANGGIAAINIGDATRNINGKFQLFPNHSRITEVCEKIGFTTLPYILWKKPTNRPKYKGKGAFLGSGFLPPNAYVTLDCEFILLFRKGKLRKFEPHQQDRYESKFTKVQRDVWFSQIWDFKGTRQTVSELERRTAAYPDEVAERLIRMFSVRGEKVLDPFLGSGTTTKVAIVNERNSIGYEADAKLLQTIMQKIEKAKINAAANVNVTERST